MATDAASREAQDNVAARGNGQEQQRGRSRRGSLWSRFRNLSQRGMRGSNQRDDIKKEDSAKKPHANGVVIGGVVRKQKGEEKKDHTVPQLKSEEQDDVDDGDKKPAAKVKDVQKKEEIVVVPVTMDEAEYSTERMVKALKKLAPYLHPEPSTDETGELDSVFERKFAIKDDESAKVVVDVLMRSDSNDVYSPELQLLTVNVFRNAFLRNRDLTKQLLEEGSAEIMIGARIIDQWKYVAIKNLEHLSTTVGDDEKNWYHATTASFFVMEYLKFVWDCLITEKKEQLIDKKKQLNTYHEEYGLEWNQSDYLNDVKACGRTIGAEAIVKTCDTNKNRLMRIMDSRDIVNYNAGRHRCMGVNRTAPTRRDRAVPIRRDIRPLEAIERAERERRHRAEVSRRLEDMRAAGFVVGVNATEEGDAARGARRNDGAADNNERSEQGNSRVVENPFIDLEALLREDTARAQRNIQAAAAGNNERSEEDRNCAERPPADALLRDVVQIADRALRNDEVVLDNSERSALDNNHAERPRAAIDIEARSSSSSDGATSDDESVEQDGNREVEATGNNRVERPRAAATDSEALSSRSDRAAVNNDVAEQDGDRNDGATGNAESAEQDGTGNDEGDGDRNDGATGSDESAASTARARRNDGAIVNDERAEQDGNRTIVDGDLLHEVLLPRRSDRAAVNNTERAARDENRLPRNGRENEDFSAAVARAAFPHIAEERRAVLARALRDDEDRAAAIARRLDIEEDEMLWGPRLPARRRMMMARRARGGQLDALEALEAENRFDMIAHMEALELHHDHFERLMRPTARQPPRRPRPPPEPFVPPHLRELRELEESAKIQPFSISDGLELVKPSPDFDTQQIFIKRVTACVGWAIHGLIFEFVDGSRNGTLMVNPGDRPMRLNDKNLADRACVGWTDIEYGDYIVGMHGDNLAAGVQEWFCYSLILEFASGKSVHYEAHHEPWRGEPFSFTVPSTQPCFVHRISFKNDQKEDMLGLVTSIHLPISRANFSHLPLKQQQAVEDLLEIGREVDLMLEHGGRKLMGEDVWWLILGFIRGWELLPPSSNAKGSKDGQRLFDLYARRHEYSLQS